MKVKRAKRENVSGPVKGFFMGLGGIGTAIGFIGLCAGEIGGGLLFMAVGLGICGIASLFPDKTRITY